jgi:hypothetical protein
MPRVTPSNCITFLDFWREHYKSSNVCMDLDPKMFKRMKRTALKNMTDMLIMDERVRFETVHEGRNFERENQ